MNAVDGSWLETFEIVHMNGAVARIAALNVKKTHTPEQDIAVAPDVANTLLLERPLHQMIRSTCLQKFLSGLLAACKSESKSTAAGHAQECAETTDLYYQGPRQPSKGAVFYATSLFRHALRASLPRRICVISPRLSECEDNDTTP